jgi:hypothetical protein
VLLTRSPVSPSPKARFSLDLHVLGAPPAFVLSQDQTLHWRSSKPAIRPKDRGWRVHRERIRKGHGLPPGHGDHVIRFIEQLVLLAARNQFITPSALFHRLCDATIIDGAPPYSQRRGACALALTHCAVFKERVRSIPSSFPWSLFLKPGSERRLSDYRHATESLDSYVPGRRMVSRAARTRRASSGG